MEDQRKSLKWLLDIAYDQTQHQNIPKNLIMKTDVKKFSNKKTSDFRVIYGMHINLSQSELIFREWSISGIHQNAYLIEHNQDATPK